jgi:hypothetical protein
VVLVVVGLRWAEQDSCVLWAIRSVRWVETDVLGVFIGPIGSCEKWV